MINNIEFFLTKKLVNNNLVRFSNEYKSIISLEIFFYFYFIFLFLPLYI